MTTHTLDNPFTGHTACEVPFATWSEVEAVLDRARAAVPEVAAAPLEERLKLARAATDLIEERAASIATDMARMMGKPVAQGRGEVATMVARSRAVCDYAAEALAPIEIDGGDGITRRILKMPLGVVVDFPAWNYPLLTAVNCVIPALLAGNAVILKHSPRSPLCGPVFGDAFKDAGAPEHWVQSLDCDHDTSERMVGDARVDHVVFTGSVFGGERISKAAAGRFLQIGYELGGNDPAYVAEDADLARAVDSLVDGAIYNAGQSCCAVERVFVHRSHYEDFVSRALPLVEAYVMGDPLDEATTLGPVAQPHHAENLAGLVRDATRGGAKVLTGGRACEVDGRGRFFEPTLLVGVQPQMRVMREEAFGPLLTVASVDSDEEAIERMKDSRYGLTASVWTASMERAERFGQALPFGTVFMNRCDFVDPLLPWSGVGDSGRGHSLSVLGFDQLTRPRALHFKP